MTAPTCRTGGAQRARMVLDSYDRDPDSDRFSRLLTDLAEYAQDAGFAPLDSIAVYAVQRAGVRRCNLDLTRSAAPCDECDTEQPHGPHSTWSDSCHCRDCVHARAEVTG